MHGLERYVSKLLNSLKQASKNSLNVAKNHCSSIFTDWKVRERSACSKQQSLPVIFISASCLIAQTESIILAVLWTYKIGQNFSAHYWVFAEHKWDHLVWFSNVPERMQNNSWKINHVCKIVKLYPHFLYCLQDKGKFHSRFLRYMQIWFGSTTVLFWKDELSLGVYKDISCNNAWSRAVAFFAIFR